MATTPPGVPTPPPPGASQIFITTWNVLTVPASPNPQYMTPVIGRVVFQLCGYGSQMPQGVGLGFIGKGTEDATNEGEGEFSTWLMGNDSISPAGTYYAVTFMDENDDILQTNAYVIPSGSQLDLSSLVPYDPNLPPPPLPAPITSQLLIVPWSETMVFPGDIYTTYRVTLTGDVTSSTAPNTVQGNLYTYIIQQDIVGGHQFAWPPDIYNPSPINPDGGGFTVQTFVMGVYNLIPIGPAGWWQ